jgi:acetyltransferase-like isoleucine patch superfamily enzyme
MIQFLWKLYLRVRNPTCRLNALAIGRNVKLENDVTIRPGAVVSADLVGRFTFINRNVLIDKSTERIGRFCSIAYGAKIGLGDHPTDWVSTHPFAYEAKYGLVDTSIDFHASPIGRTIIGHDVWIGANAIILAGVTVGDGAIIGANSLVTKDVKAYSVVVGTPARHIKYRFDQETCSELLKSEWWNWEAAKIKDRIRLSSKPIEFIAN